MPDNMILGLSAIIALVPSSLLAMRRNHRPDMVFWMVLIVAVAGPAIWVLFSLAGSWQTNLATALWVTVAATMTIFAVVTILTRESWRLTPLVTVYMTALGIIAMIWGSASHKPLAAAATADGWIGVHIGVSVATYALVTIAAVAALAAFLQERALKNKRPTTLSRLLPSVADCEELEVRLLVLGEIVLALGLASGMALQYGETGSLLVFDHKTVLTITAFAVIGGLLVAHYKTGLRGRQAARIVLLAYLLLTLGYPGVKFITDVILA
ncbi:MAG: cytochrome c biogenesis protein CcsA [Rhodospirillales bacterium]|nr:cytochrome c biogenesis protein CcsA [Rhodospirillales bacterium]